jgi:hypothetical protein
LLNAVVANARQISAPPGCAFVRFTKAQVKPPPVTPVTVRPPDATESAETKANNNSFGAVVENAGVVTDVFAEVRSVDVEMSIANCPGGREAVTVRAAVVAWLMLPLTPVIVSVDVPTGVELRVLTVTVEVPDPITVAGLKVAVAPVGNPVALRVTVPENPP